MNKKYFRPSDVHRTKSQGSTGGGVDGQSGRSRPLPGRGQQTIAQADPRYSVGVSRVQELQTVELSDKKSKRDFVFRC